MQTYTYAYMRNINLANRNVMLDPYIIAACVVSIKRYLPEKKKKKIT